MPVVDEATWLTKRKELLEKEKQLMKLKDEVSCARRSLGMKKVSTDYVFQGVDGDVKLSELFGSHDQLIVVHFMFGPDWENSCSSCSLWADGYSSVLPHINRKAAFAVTAGAPVEKLQAALKRKNWTFPFLSAGKSTFRADFGVNFSAEDVAARKPLYNYGRPFPSTEGPGYSVFYKDADGAVYHTFSTFARGMEPACAVWGFFDMLPRGRNETRPMDWLKHKEDY